MARQLDDHPALAERLGSPVGHVVVLERVARSAGATRWFLAHSPNEVRQIFEWLGPGSRVTFYFSPTMRKEQLSDQAIGEMFNVVQSTGEIVIGTPDPADPLLLHVELVAGPSELSAFLTQPHAPAEVVWGAYPGVSEPDSISVVLVDKDGVLRPHPH